MGKKRAKDERKERMASERNERNDSKRGGSRRESNTGGSSSGANGGGSIPRNQERGSGVGAELRPGSGKRSGRHRTL